MDAEIKIDVTGKSFQELYGPGTGKDSVDTSDDAFLPLLLAIEETITLAFRRNPSMTDGLVLAVLDKLCQNHEAAYPHDPLAGEVQNLLKAVVSLNKYSRQDVRLALRKVKQSVNRHNKLGGTRGYLTFIDDFLPK
jgi:hypothetical protein